MKKGNYSKAWRMMLMEIVHGLKIGIDVSVYAKPEYSYNQMVQIRFGLQRGLDVSIYAKPEYPSTIMSILRHAMELDIDVSDYDGSFQTLTKYEKQFTIENELKAIKKRYSEIKNIDKYSRDQLFAIDQCIFFHGATQEMVNNYINPNMDVEYIYDILVDISRKDDIIKYVSPDMDFEHLEIISHALNNNVKFKDFEPYINKYDKYDSDGILQPYIEDNDFINDDECDEDCINCQDCCIDLEKDKSNYADNDVLNIAMNVLSGKKFF